MASQAQLSYPTAAMPRSGADAIRTCFATDDAWSSLVLRLMLAAVIFPHGAQKLFGWFGGFGFAGTMNFFTETLHVPAAVALLVILGESVGALLLAAGFLTRFVALSLATIMVGAVALVHWPYGFFMNWSGQQAGEGFEYHLLVIAISAALALSGGGRWSIDRRIGGTA